jgi:hypothetical protein
MRELSTSLRMYAAMNRDIIPIGFMDQKAFNYIMYFNNTLTSATNPPKPSQMGLIVAANYNKNPKAFYCPAEPEGTYYNYQPNPSATVPSENPWPFWETPSAPLGRNAHTRLGYAARPIVNWPANQYANSADSRFWLPSDGTRLTLPKVAKITNLAILADINYSREPILVRHGGLGKAIQQNAGINVLYGNGSAKWVRLGHFDKFKPGDAGYAASWSSLNEISAFTPATGNPRLLNDGTWLTGNAGGYGTLVPYSQHTGLWVDLDRAP